MKELQSLNFGRLSILELGQHVKSVNSSVAALGIITDADLLRYLATSNQQIVDYDKAMLQIKKSDETEKIAIADRLRDNSVSTLTRQLSVFEISEDANEVLAYKSLKTIFNTYKDIQKWNFEEETNGINNLINDLNSSKNQPNVALLNMTSMVNKLETNNNNFKTLFDGRTQETAGKEVFDTKKLRTNLTNTNKEMCNYVLAISKVRNNAEFNKSLDVINAVRKYYSDLLAKRKPATATTPEEEIPPLN